LSVTWVIESPMEITTLFRLHLHKWDRRLWWQMQVLHQDRSFRTLIDCNATTWKYSSLQYFWRLRSASNEFRMKGRGCSLFGAWILAEVRTFSAIYQDCRDPPAVVTAIQRRFIVLCTQRINWLPHPSNDNPPTLGCIGAGREEHRQQKVVFVDPPTICNTYLVTWSSFVRLELRDPLSLWSAIYIASERILEFTIIILTLKSRVFFGVSKGQFWDQRDLPCPISCYITVCIHSMYT
jgi:hypothetical protein